MSSIVPLVISNVLLAAGLAIITVVLTRFWQSPQLAHTLWALVLLKLVTPPIAAFSVSPEWLVATGGTELSLTDPSIEENDGPIINEAARPTFLVDDLPQTEAGPQSIVGDSQHSPARANSSSSPIVSELTAVEPALAAGDVAESPIEPIMAPPSNRATLSIEDHSTRDVAGNSRPSGMRPQETVAPRRKLWDRSVGYATTYWLTIVGTLWCVGAVVYLLVLLQRCVRFKRVLVASRAAPKELNDAASRLAATLEMKRCPPVRVVDMAIPPLVWSLGIWPIVLLPNALLSELDDAERNAVITHELAHVRRRDDLVRWLELISLVIYWWNPVAWFARRKLREAEEECCDAWVVWALPDQRRNYGKAMLKTIEFVSERPVLPVPAGSAFGGSFYRRRIEMIMKRNVHRKMSRAAFVVAGLLALAVLPIAAQTQHAAMAAPDDFATTTHARQSADERQVQNDRIPGGLKKRLGPLSEKLVIPSNATIEEHDDSYEVSASPWHTTTTQVYGEAHLQAHHDHQQHKSDDPYSTDDHSHRIIQSQYLADEGKLSVPKSDKGSIIFEMIGDADFYSDIVSYSADRVEYRLGGPDARILLTGHAKLANEDKGVRLSADRIIIGETSTRAEGSVRLVRSRPGEQPEVLTAERLDIDHESNTVTASLTEVGTTAAVAKTSAAEKAEEQAGTRVSKLLQERIDTLREIAQLQQAAYQASEVGLDSLLKAKKELIEAQLGAARTQEEAEGLRPALVELAGELEAIVQAQFKSQPATKADVLKAKAFRLQLEATATENGSTSETSQLGR